MEQSGRKRARSAANRLAAKTAQTSRNACRGVRVVARTTKWQGTHGVQVPSDDPAAVKPWLADHQSDPAVQAALEACAGPDNTGAGKKAGGTEPGPTADALVACLERHGVDVPSDAKQTRGALKPWLTGAMQQPTVKAALNECAGGPAPNRQKK